MHSIDEQALPAWRLFKVPYRVGIREMFFYNKEQVALFGRPTSGDKTLDQAMMNNYRTVMIPVCTDDTRNIRGMDHYFNLGADILFLDVDDIPVVYRDIVEHLQDWENYVKNNLHHANEAPVDDLIQLDDLKNAMFILTQKVEDPLIAHKDKSVLKRTFGRTRSPFNNQYHQDEEKLLDSFSMDGSHIFRPGDNSVSEPTVNNLSEADSIRQHMKKIPDGGVKDFTSIFEKYKMKQQRDSAKWDD